MKVGTVIVAAGRSQRMEGIDKLDIVYDGRTVLENVLLKFIHHERISEIVLAVSEEKKDYAEEMVAGIERNKPVHVVTGGASRLASVKNGIAALSKDTDYFCIHDAARPFVSSDLITRTIEAAVCFGAAVGAISVGDTIKTVNEDDFVTSTLNREVLRAVGTPQVFNARDYLQALELFPEDTAFDDCQLVERISVPVKIVKGEETNIKITSRDSLERCFKEDSRIGHGYDVHRLIAGMGVTLGGVFIPCESSLLGHSDADVLVHAIVDALLGASSLGDIGGIFPDTDEQYKGISSIILLERTAALLRQNGYRVGNIDSTVICETPRLAGHITAMRRTIAAAVEIEEERVSVKATTEEGLGFTGTGQGIAAHAVAAITRMTAISS